MPAILVAACLAWGVLTGPDMTRAAAAGVAGALVAMAVVLVFRLTGVVSFAHFGLAALAAALLGRAAGPAGLIAVIPAVILGAAGSSLILHQWAYARLAQSPRVVGTLAGMLAMQLLLAARLWWGGQPEAAVLSPLIWHVVAAAGMLLVVVLPVLLRPLLDSRTAAPLVCAVAGALAGAAGAFAGLLFPVGAGPLSGATLGEFPVVPMATALIAAGMAGLRDPGLAAVMAFALNIALAASEAGFGSPHAYQLALMLLLSAALLLRRRKIPPVVVGPAADPLLPSSLAAVVKNVQAPLTVAAAVGVPVLAVVAGLRPAVTELAGYCLVGLSLTMLMGWIGQVTLGQLGFALLGAWITSASGLPAVAGILLGAVIAAILSPAVAYTAIRHAGSPAPVTSLAWGLFSYTLFTSPDLLGWARLLSPQTGPFTATGSGGPDFVAAVAVIGCLGGFALASRTRFVRLLVAARLDPAIATRAGMVLPRARLKALLFTGFVAGLGGGLLAVAQHGLLPDGYATDSGVRLVTSTGIGGIGAVLGPILGVLVFGGVITIFAAPAVRFLATGWLGLSALLAEPAGLTGLLRRLRSFLRRSPGLDGRSAAAEVAVNDAQI